MASRPLPSEDLVYDLDLSDVAGDTVELKILAPAGYWLIDRLVLDYSDDQKVKVRAIEADGVDDPEADEVLEALNAEDGETYSLDPGLDAVLTFTLPPRSKKLERTLYLWTVNCYDMPPTKGNRHN